MIWRNLSIVILLTTSILSAQSRKEMRSEFNQRKSENRKTFESEQKALRARFNKLDFNEAKVGVDLSKVVLVPEEAEMNLYDKFTSDRNRVIQEVSKYKGVPYLWGGDNPNAFDCSGLVQWTIKKTHGKTIPRTTATQYKAWSQYMKKDLRHARPGDFVYFKTRNVQSAVSHVGVYLGDNKFIHAPKRNDVVKISELKDYWVDKFVGFTDLNNVIN